MKLEVSLFKFDYKSDYLPYYKKYHLKIENEITLLDLLNSINEKENFSYESCDSFLVKVNNIFTSCEVNLMELVNKVGNEITIEPISTKRCMNDLIINEDDFYSKLSLLEKFISKTDIKRYEDYKIYYYASNTLNFEKDYIGDAILLLANDLINENSKNKEEILNIIKTCEFGIQYHTSLENRVFNIDKNIEKIILNLKNLLSMDKEENKQNFKINKKNSISIQEASSEIIENSFNEFNISYYSNSNCILNYLNKLEAKIIHIENSSIDLAKNSFHINKEFTFKLASTVLLEAFDKGADFIVVDNLNDFYIFDFNRKELNKIARREVNIPVLHINELKNLAAGNFDEAKKSLNNHSINPKLI
ncbi:succinate dehydrogenase/fumarate reductase-like Fe-S protein [Malaciobacter marinus]|jgi:hypothetical protein|uniref:Succinate dehydrogenase/fumarate reductase-like Fe-S protein n=1 Tax=Malaciobacter marinus TaxID=505249 RepID=A0AB36ZS16_9BACT|nr:2Fe-2S iron-sulfur cluster-binding protein [Malaciobacter marinus]PPK58529.1 succinate dehydrogenase/fumarate reductase-like Fe-S protein [Malaciobacter marinus]